MPVKSGAQDQQQQCRETGNGAADAPGKPPGHGQADQADSRAEQSAGLKQL